MIINVPTNPDNIDKACMKRYGTALDACIKFAIVLMRVMIIIVKNVYIPSEIRNADMFLSEILSGFKRKYKGTVRTVTRISSIRSNHSSCPIMLISTELMDMICIRISKYIDGNNAYSSKEPYSLKSFFSKCIPPI